MVAWLCCCRSRSLHMVQYKLCKLGGNLVATINHLLLLQAYSTLQYNTRYITVQYMQHSTLQYSTVQYSIVHVTVQYSIVHVTVQYNLKATINHLLLLQYIADECLRMKLTICGTGVLRHS